MRTAGGRMELYQLRTFLAIARTGNLTRAAQNVATSQPAVSAQLKALEDELGVALFARTARGMELTEAGRQLRAKAEEVDARAAELLALAGALSGKVVGRCRVGLNTDAGVLRVPALVEAVAATSPHLTLELVQGTSRSVGEDVASGRLAAGFVFGAHGRAELEALPLSRVELAVAAPAAWAGRLARAPLAEVLAGPWVWPPRDCPFHDTALALVRAAGARPAGGVAADDEVTLLRLVAAGAGLSLVPAFMAAEAEAKGEVVRVPAPGAEVALSFVWRGRDGSAPLLEPVLAALRGIWGLAGAAPQALPGSAKSSRNV
jgi:DNA-binding transcriptional LysR family regulator